MKKLIQNLLRENLVSQSDLNALEAELDALFRNVGVDVEFTKHFLDRVNDKRNGRQITIDELRQMYHDAYRMYGKKFKKLPDGDEGVMQNPPTSINIPFVLDKNTEDKLVDLINKTVMRKKDFRPAPTDTVLNVNPTLQQDNTPREQEPMIKINGVSWIVDVENEALVKKNNRSEIMKLDVIMNKLPDEAQEKILSYF